MTHNHDSIVHRRYALKALAGLALCPLCASAGFAEAGKWSYEGVTAPDKWGGLDAANAVCSTGSQQSPINLTEGINARQPLLRIEWSKQPSTITNNGHTIQLDFAKGTNGLKVGGRGYELKQFHFHHPSEHHLEGKGFAMEAHFVHAAESGGLAVVGVFIRPGKRNAAFSKIVSTMPAAEGPSVAADPAINPVELLPIRRDFFHYEGSLTTPPCSEIVDWFVLAQPIEAAASDIDRFAQLYAMNARPIQDRNRRFILSSGGS